MTTEKETQIITLSGGDSQENWPKIWSACAYELKLPDINDRVPDSEAPLGAPREVLERFGLSLKQQALLERMEEMRQTPAFKALEQQASEGQLSTEAALMRMAELVGDGVAEATRQFFRTVDNISVARNACLSGKEKLLRENDTLEIIVPKTSKATAPVGPDVTPPSR